jgi:hypothetical protein
VHPGGGSDGAAWRAAFVVATAFVVLLLAGKAAAGGADVEGCGALAGMMVRGLTNAATSTRAEGILDRIERELGRPSGRR